MKTITFTTLCLALTLGGCADEGWQHPRSAAPTYHVGPNQAKQHDANYQRALDRAIEDQEAFDSVDFSEHK